MSTTIEEAVNEFKKKGEGCLAGILSLGDFCEYFIVKVDKDMPSQAIDGLFENVAEMMRVALRIFNESKKK